MQPPFSAKSRRSKPSSMVSESWFKKLISAGRHSIWQDAAPSPGSNDVPMPISLALLHTVLHGLVLLVVLGVLKWTWTKAGSKPSNTLFKSDATTGEVENKNREHGGRSNYLCIGTSTHQLVRFRVDSPAFRLSRSHSLCARAQKHNACSISSISVG